MTDLCTDTSNALSQALGGFDCDAGPVSLRNPADLSNWTLPVLELLMVAGAAVALLFAVRRFREQRDGTTLAMGLAGVVYVLAVEIPMYFPGKLGLEDHLGSVFVHNVFTVDLVVDRLPLYIVALYVALPVLAYEVVRGLGVFERRGNLLGALCVGVVHSAFYEVFDHLGPQLRWWSWNSANEYNHPMFGSVPMTSVTLFSLVAPAGLVWMLRRWVTGRALSLPATLARATGIGLLVPLWMTVAAIPFSVLGGDDPRTTAQAVVLAAELGLAWLVAVPVLWSCWRAGAAAPSLPVRVFGPLYLVVIAALWISALPDFVDAVGGVSPDGTPIGNLPFAAVCFTAALVVVVATLRGTGPGTGAGTGRADGTQGLGRVAAGR